MLGPDGLPHAAVHAADAAVFIYLGRERSSLLYSLLDLGFVTPIWCHIITLTPSTLSESP